MEVSVISLTADAINASPLLVALKMHFTAAKTSSVVDVDSRSTTSMSTLEPEAATMMGAPVSFSDSAFLKGLAAAFDLLSLPKSTTTSPMWSAFLLFTLGFLDLGGGFAIYLHGGGFLLAKAAGWTVLV